MMSTRNRRFLSCMFSLTYWSRKKTLQGLNHSFASVHFSKINILLVCVSVFLHVVSQHFHDTLEGKPFRNVIPTTQHLSKLGA
jgi:hypothetical protein